MFGFRRTLWILVAVLAAGLSACLDEDPVSTEPASEEVVQDQRHDVPVPGAISPAPEFLPSQVDLIPAPGEPPLADRPAGVPSWVGDSEANSGLPIAGLGSEPGSAADGPGGIDILFRNVATGENAVWHMDGTNLVGFSPVSSAPTVWDLGGLADFDGDARADFVWRNTTTGQDALWLMQGVSFGSFLSLPTVSSLSWQIVGAADFTGDGKPDLLWRNTSVSSGDIAIWEMNGDQFVAYHRVGRTSTDWKIVGTGDFNGDGDEDIVFRNHVTGGNALWLLSGTAFSSYQGLPRVSDLAWTIGGAGDLTGDGDPDLVWQRSSGTVAAWEMSGVTFAAYHGISTLGNTDWHVTGLAQFDVCSLDVPDDADGDRLPDCAETNTGVYVGPTDTGTDPFDADTDDDDLEDGEEVLGTEGGLDLPAMGVNPLRKDVLVEYDWFDDALECGAHSHRPTAATVAMLTAAFADAPISNPDGSSGINYIHDYGQGGVFTGGNLIADADGVLGGGFDSEYQAHKAANFQANRNGYFHYAILPHRYNTDSGSSGLAEVGGDDMIISLNCAGSDQNVAHTTMHELGHNLTLLHGGFEGRNWKPNYNSVMNYKYQFPGIDDDCTPPGDGVMDYSREVRPSLDENNLDENQGVCGNPPGPGWDWNGSGDLETAVVFDINVDFGGTGDGQYDVLNSYNDWANVYLTVLPEPGIEPFGADQTVEIIECTNIPPMR